MREDAIHGTAVEKSYPPKGGQVLQRRTGLERETGLEPATLCLGRVGSSRTGYQSECMIGDPCSTATFTLADHAMTALKSSQLAERSQ